MMTVRQSLALRAAKAVRSLVPCVALVALFGATAQASLLPPGVTALAVGEAEPGPSAIVATLTVPVVAPTFTGSLTSTVLSGDPTNPFPGGLTFIYDLSNDPGSPHAVHRLTVSNFTGFLTDVSYSTLTPGIAPTLMDRGPLAGDVVGFTFVGFPLGAGALVPGGVATTLVVQTDATIFTVSKAAVIDGSTANVDTLAPKAIPEPATLVMALIGAALSGFWFWRRR
ncbi:MAG: PEP-CTERM sorting domain-containing protein [Pirellulales bacterium]|nr:PEP-CTERM sorting domain-containing protein [Pirellulales bacterium]